MSKYINQKDMRGFNAADVFSLIRSRGRITRKQIAEKLGMSWGAVSSITSFLIDEGYAVENKAESDGAAGRTPAYVEVSEDVYYSIGLDINDTGLRAVAVSLKNKITESIEAGSDLSDEEALISGACALIRDLIASQGEKIPICIGVAMQGIIDSASGVLVRIPGRSELCDVHISQKLADSFSLPVSLEHAPNCILFASEQRKKKEDTILIRADYGIGMAVMMGGRIIDKPGIFELGHTIAVPDGLPCGCGKRGCLGQYASIRGLIMRSGKKFNVLCSDADIGDEESQVYFNEAAHHLAYATANTAHLLNIDNILLCGKLFEAKDLFFEEFLKNIATFSPDKELKFSFTSVCDAAPGAAMIGSGTVLKKIPVRGREE